MNPTEIIIGLYENLNANYHEEDSTNSNMINYILENIHQKITKYPLLFIISSTASSLTKKNMNRPKDDIVFKKYFFNGSSIEFEGNYTESKIQFEKMKNYLINNYESKINDFDDHFDDVNNDWRNLFIKD